MLFDTHTHVNFAAFSAKGGSGSGGKDDAEETIKRALDQNTWMVNVGTQLNTSTQAIELAKKFDQGVYAAVGLHPIHTWQQVVDEEEDHFRSHQEIFDPAEYTPLLSSNRVVAVGECGLDYFRLPKEPAFAKASAVRQKTEFIKQISFAKEHKLPLIVHCRDAYEDVLEVLKAEYAGTPGIIHSFTGDWPVAKKFLDLGFYIAFNGILTFDKTGRLAEVCEKSPIEKILTETDAPYLTPPPYRGKRNEPAYVRYVAIKIAEIKGMETDEVCEYTFNNACKLFNINGKIRS